MDSTKAKELSDEQLVALYRNPATPQEIKEILLKELSLRDQEDLKKESSKQNVDTGFTESEKLQLIFLPFLYRKHRKTMFENGWSRKKDKQFWNYITLGIAIYSALLMIGLLFRNR